MVTWTCLVLGLPALSCAYQLVVPAKQAPHANSSIFVKEPKKWLGSLLLLPLSTGWDRFFHGEKTHFHASRGSKGYSALRNSFFHAAQSLEFVLQHRQFLCNLLPANSDFTHSSLQKLKESKDRRETPGLINLAECLCKVFCGCTSFVCATALSKPVISAV